MRYRQYVDAAEKLTREQALDQLLRTYLANAAYAVPIALARHLRMEEPELRAGIDRLVEAGRAEKSTLPGYKGECYLWTGDARS